MPFGPIDYVLSRSERKQAGTKMMDVVPSLAWRLREVNKQAGLQRDTVHDVDLHRFAFATDLSMDSHLAFYERCNTQRVPHACRPPSDKQLGKKQYLAGEITRSPTSRHPLERARGRTRGSSSPSFRRSSVGTRRSRRGRLSRAASTSSHRPASHWWTIKRGRCSSAPRSTGLRHTAREQPRSLDAPLLQRLRIAFRSHAFPST
jgi:hypothetical protein